MQEKSILRRIFRQYTNSFDHYMVARKSCSPPGVLLLLAVAFGVLSIPSARDALGITRHLPSLLFVTTASLFSLASWKAYPNRTLVSLFQLFEIYFYSLTLTSVSACSNAATSFLFSALWLIAIFNWATIFGYSILGTISVLIGPVLVGIFTNVSPTYLLSVVLGAMLWIYISQMTRAKWKQQEKTIRVLSILDNAIDHAVDLRRSNLQDFHNLKLVSILHKAKNDLIPAQWNIEYLSRRGGLSEENQAVAEETKGCIESTLSDLLYYLEKYRSRLSEVNFYNLSELKECIQEQLSAFPQLRFLVDCGADPLIEGRMDDIRLAITTLIENSVDAGATRVILKNDSPRDGDSVMLRLEDNGSGIPGKVKERLFEPFNTFGKRNGVGLGLYLASRLISASNGKLGLLKSDKNGTAFSVQLSLHLPLHNEVMASQENVS